MKYSYNYRTAAEPPAPTYKGKALKPHGQDSWILEGHGATIHANFKKNGWEAWIEMKDRPALPGKTYGKDLDKVIEDIIKAEKSRIKGAQKQLDDAEKALDSLDK